MGLTDRKFLEFRKPELNSEPHLNPAIEEIYECALDPSRWPQALRLIADAFGDPAAVLTFERDDGTFGLVGPPGAEPGLEEYKRAWSHRDIRALRAKERGYLISGHVITDRDLLEPGERQTDPFYTEYLSRFKQGYFAGAGVSPDRNLMVALSVHRRIERTEYSDAEKQAIGVIARHVERSLRLSIRLMDAELVNRALGEALARMGLGVFALDSLGRIVFSNPAGAALLGNGLDRLGERLVPRRREDRENFEDAVHKTIAAPSVATAQLPGPVLVHRDGEQRPLVAYILPASSSMADMNPFLTHARALVLLVNPVADEPVDPTLVRDLLGLTLSEARVASLVGSGLAPRETAAKLGITEETARTALKRVFSKTGITKQTELVQLVTKLAVR